MRPLGGTETLDPELGTEAVAYVRELATVGIRFVDWARPAAPLVIVGSVFAVGLLTGGGPWQVGLAFIGSGLIRAFWWKLKISAQRITVDNGHLVVCARKGEWRVPLEQLSHAVVVPRDRFYEWLRSPLGLFLCVHPQAGKADVKISPETYLRADAVVSLMRDSGVEATIGKWDRPCPICGRVVQRPGGQ